MFEAELNKFREIQERLKNEYPEGGFVVIKDDEVLGVWLSRHDALREGIARFGNIPFLVKDIRENLDDISNVINFSRDIQFA
ncbi:MAG TPA: hypothetical protein PL123_03130 [Bacteroidales bacterium]|nr:hypothetical protein [Bacteroidales bacterium]